MAKCTYDTEFMKLCGPIDQEEIWSPWLDELGTIGLGHSLRGKFTFRIQNSLYVFHKKVFTC